MAEEKKSSSFDGAWRNLSETGFHVETDLLGLNLCEELLHTSNSFENAKNGSFQSVMNPHQTDPLFLSAFKSARALEMLRFFFKGPVSGVQSQFFFGPPGCHGYTKHQDNFYLRAPTDSFISIWHALADTYPENGGLIMYPGSHVEPVLDVQDIPVEKRGPAQDPNANRFESVMQNKYPEISMKVNKNHSVFIHANVVHASHNNVSQNWRPVLLCTYIRSGAPFRSGTRAERKEIPFG